MKISRIHLEGVTTHKDRSIDLPDKGLVLISGSNGSGKSTFVEAVPWCIWGKSMRGTNLWSGKKGVCSVCVDGTLYTRSQKAPKITWEGAPKFESDKHAQEALHSQFGSLDHWRRSCVVSSTDGIQFSTATDAERKRMLEDVAGCSLDAAHQAALGFLRDAKAAADNSARRLDFARDALERMERVLAAPPPEDVEFVPEEVDQGKLQALEKALRDALEDHREVSSAMEQARQLGSRAKEAARRAEDALKKVQDTGECPTCHQVLPAPENLVAQYSAEMEKAIHDYEAHKEAYAREKQQLPDLDLEIGGIRERRDQVLQADAARRSALAAKRAVESALNQRAAAEVQRASLEEELKSLIEESAADAKEVCHWRDAAQVLSTKGIRAEILDGVIAAVQEEANAWLYRMCRKPLELSLSSHGETTKGDRKDQVSFEIAGAGGGRGYKASSGGERRRIDVALAMALAMVAEASMGSSDSTIFLDEAYDALDEEGVENLTAELKALSADRCVVVIAHGEPLYALSAVCDVHVSL